jgi:CBS domain-containing protein
MTAPQPSVSIGPSVADLMAREPILVNADASLSEAVALMDCHHVHGLPVVDGDGALVGVVSQTDLNRAHTTEYLWARWPGLSVRHLMTSPAVTVHRSTPAILAAQKMEQHQIHRLVVVEDGDERSPIGVLSMSDLIHALAAETASLGAERPGLAAETASRPGPAANEGARR